MGPMTDSQTEHLRFPRPTELAITLAALPPDTGYADSWTDADQVRGRLKLLGFDCTTQQVGAWLARMARSDAPWVERRRDAWDSRWEYRVTRYGRTDIDNRFSAVRPAATRTLASRMEFGGPPLACPRRVAP